ncbi:hypothetical protein [Acidimangrovimonas pyrenivorans]|uniref:Uncharacterized protein n=1 Tax=Acidimangrovimonas pyrenivorans TaxID=2030798 RepID=A0ABV7AC33_9RHOB
MRLALVLLVLSALAGCAASPAPPFFGAQRQQVTRGGHDYVLYRRGDRVEVIRLGYARPGEHRAIRATMLSLIPELTGCRPWKHSLHGDSGEMRGRLVCPAG